MRDDPVVVLLHPLGVDSSVWAPVASRLAGFLTSSGLRALHVVGVLLGGLVAQTLALDHPALVDRLVLVDSVAVNPRTDAADVAGTGGDSARSGDVVRAGRHSRHVVHGRGTCLNLEATVAHNDAMPARARHSLLPWNAKMQ